MIRRSAACLIPLIVFIQLHAQQGMTRLDARINSSAVEYAPSISADGKTLIFQSNRKEVGKYELYISHLSADQTWSIPQPIGAINNHEKNVALIAGPFLSYDGLSIFFCASFTTGFGSEDIYFSNRVGDGWSAPVNAGRQINTRDYEGFPSLSADGKRLYFVRKKVNPKTPGRFCTKIMVSEPDANGAWLPPKELPPVINSSCEKSPRILSDGETLIFSSNRNNVDGSFDLFITRFQADQSWSTPLALSPFNTAKDDLFATISTRGDLVYFINDATGNFDVYAAELPPEFQPRRASDIQGTVSGQLGEPVKAKIFIYRDAILQNPGGLDNNEADGTYGITLLSGFDYKIIARAPGHEADTFVLNLKNSDKYELLQHNFMLNKKEEFLTLRVKNSISKKSIDASLEGQGQRIIKHDSVGKYTTPVMYGDQVNLSLTRLGYQPAKFSFTYSNFDPQLNHSIELKPLKPSICLTLQDADTRKTLTPITIIKPQGTGTPIFQGTAPTTGVCKELQYNTVYEIKVRLKGYFSYLDTLNLSDVYDGRQLKRTISLIPIKVNHTLSLNSILFEVNSFSLSEDSKRIIDEVAYVIRQNPNIMLEVSAHTDSQGDEKFNLTLSRKRAEAVRDYLVASGIADSVLQPKGYGESMPVAPNSSEENMALNRRVEFKIIKVL